ncbi:hypothetical protein [Salisediminibacterium beveridgei]|uniref:Uncharacterized protein n=1 Tax=Salisediminibacterium beveridgei TaxID=632773 RepID=A0A1D7QWY1_9BACI|nr:hypothetical protein [Salisediminibacterium beveridgei]AOM83511.1 hypothetical protein BBEV_2153 [Salisediminibacterium beveridgei]
MVLSKWHFYQGLTVAALIGIFILAELIRGTMNPGASAQASGQVNSGIPLILFVGIVVGCFYLIFLFETKKENNLFVHDVWRKMPFIVFGVGAVSLIIFMIAFATGPLFHWTQDWGYLIYGLMSYFIFLVFVFVFSVVSKNRDHEERDEKTAHLAYLWTLGLILVPIFLIPPV